MLFAITSNSLQGGNINLLKNGGKPNFFREITIPGDVLDDTRLSDGAKILYGKIARLAFLDGHCWSSNSFLDGTKTGRNASRFIAELKDSGYISIENERGKNRKIRVCRVDSKVSLANFGEVDESDKTNLANSGEVEEFDKTNPANSGEVVNPEKANPASFGEVEELESSNPASFGEVEKAESPNPAKFGDRTSSSSLNLYNKTTTSYGSDKSNDNLHAVEKAASAAYFSPKEIKAALSSLDKSLIFGDSFYAGAAAFISEKSLGLKYLSWLYEQCCLKENVRSLKAYYFSVFFLDNVADEYKAAQLPEPPEPKPPPPSVVCEACGETHARSDAKCPSCGLPEYCLPDQVLLYRELHKLPPYTREEYFHRQNSVFEECGFNFDKLKPALAALKKEYGLTDCL